MENDPSVRNSLIAAMQGMGYSSMDDVTSNKPRPRQPRPQVRPQAAQQLGTMQGNRNGGRPSTPINPSDYAMQPQVPANGTKPLWKPR
jgi:hypothetical protein